MHASPESQRLHLVLPTDLSVLERVVDDTEAFLSDRFEDDDFVYRAVLLTTEAVTNAIEHGNALDAEKCVTLDVSCDGDLCTIVVEDEGEGFARAEVANPLASEHLLDDGGRGLFLIEAMANEVRYENGGRRVVVVLDRAAPPPIAGA